MQYPPKKHMVKLQGYLQCDLSGYKDKGWHEKQAWGRGELFPDFWTSETSETFC